MFDDRRSRMMVDAEGWLWMMMEMNEDDYIVKNITIYILHDLGMQKRWKPTLSYIQKYLSNDFRPIIS